MAIAEAGGLSGVLSEAILSP